MDIELVITCITMVIELVITCIASAIIGYMGGYFLRKTCEKIENKGERNNTGVWIKDELGTTVICSKCKRPRRDNRVYHLNFCNSCGADMRGENDA